MTYSLDHSVVCLSYFQAKPACRDALIKALYDLIEPTLKESGCLEYELLIDNKDPNFLIMLEKFTSLDALTEHEQQPYIKDFVENEMMQYCERVTWNVAQKVIK